MQRKTFSTYRSQIIVQCGAKCNVGGGNLQFWRGDYYLVDFGGGENSSPAPPQNSNPPSRIAIYPTPKEKLFQHKEGKLYFGAGQIVICGGGAIRCFEGRITYLVDL